MRKSRTFIFSDLLLDNLVPFFPQIRVYLTSPMKNLNLILGVVTHCTYTTYFSWSIRSHVIMLEHVRERRSSLGLPFPLFFLFTSYLTTTYPTGLKNHSYQSEIKSVEKRKYLLYFSLLIGTLKITLHTFRNGIVQYWP